MRRFILLLLISFVGTSANSQVAKKVVVEHFTNSVCSVCANKNPGFFTNLANHPDILHIAVHPSSPYASCQFNQHNVTDNDDRTNYYSVYGGTPRFVINGDVQSTSVNLNDAALFTPYSGQTTPVSMRIVQDDYATDSIQFSVIVKAEAVHSLDTQLLFLAVAEDTVFYSSPNGETEHFDVLRKTLTGAGLEVLVPTTIGDSIVFNYTVTADAQWDFARMFGIGILQNKDDNVVTQSGISEDRVQEPLPTAIILQEKEVKFHVYPNPMQDILNIRTGTSGMNTVRLYASSGQLLHQQEFSVNTTLDVQDYPKGFYMLEIATESGQRTKQKLFRE